MSFAKILSASQEENLYKRLGLTNNASYDNIISFYYSFARSLLKNAISLRDSNNSEEYKKVISAFNRITEAFLTLHATDSRFKYDEEGEYKKRNGTDPYKFFMQNFKAVKNYVIEDRRATEKTTVRRIQLTEEGHIEDNTYHSVISENSTFSNGRSRYAEFSEYLDANPGIVSELDESILDALRQQFSEGRKKPSQQTNKRGNLEDIVGGL